MTGNHIHHHARRHHEAENRLKNLLNSYNPKKEKMFPMFLWTFLIVLLSILIIRNWAFIMEYFTAPEKQKTEQIDTIGATKGIESVYKIDYQAGMDYKRTMDSIGTVGSTKGAQANSQFGKLSGDTLVVAGEEPPKTASATLKNTIWITNYLSTGQIQTKMDQKNAKALQKSIIATYYLGEKTVDIYSTLDLDTKILSNIKNSLSVDLFQYLNQSANRSDKLDEYLSLLESELKKTDERIQDLQYKINFLSTNAKSAETSLNTSEKTFFENLNLLNGENSEEELGKFIGMQKNSTEIKAKLGAYTGLQNYYKFFKPKLENLIKTINLNRAALVAGVKVVEIQNMALPLIIKSK